MKETVGQTDRQTDRQTKTKLTYEILVAWTFSVRGLNATVAINEQNWYTCQSQQE